MQPLRAPVVLLIVITGMLPGGRADSADSIETRIDRLFEPWDRPDTPGAAVAVARGPETIYEKSFGLASLTFNVPISAETRFNVGSVAKQITSTALLMLEADGELSLDDSVHRYIPELHDYGAPITIRQLLQHTSGLRDYRTLMFLAGWRSGDVQTNEQALRLTFRQTGLNFPTGQSFGYSNTNYVLAAEIVARVTGTSFADWVRDNLLSPLGMPGTHIREDYTEVIPGLASSYARHGKGEGFVEDTLETSVAGAGNLVTSLNGLLVWADHLMTGRLGAAPLLDAVTEQAVLPPAGTRTGYGLGLYVGAHRGLRVVHHGGGTAGNRAYLMIFPEEDIRIVVLSNSSTIRPEAAARSIADVVLEGSFASEPVEPIEQHEPALPLAAYAGLYELESGVLVEVGVADDVPYVVVGGTSAHPMHSLGDHTFGTDEAGVLFRFFDDPQGTVTRVVLELAESEISGSRIAPLSLEPAELERYAGTYFSEDLETFYRIDGNQDGTLVMRQLRLDDVILKPIGNDRFREEPGGNIVIEFQRGRRGRIERFDLSISRARHIVFQRQ